MAAREKRKKGVGETHVHNMYPDPVHKKNSLINIEQNVMFYILFFIPRLPNLMCLHTQHVSMTTVGSATVLVYSEPPGLWL